MWHQIEESVLAQQDSAQRTSTEPVASSAPLVSALISIMYHATRKVERKWFPLSILWNARIREAMDELQYALIRERFIESAGKGQGTGQPLPEDFDFAGYLRRISSKRAAEVLEVSVNTWWVLILFLICILEIPALLEFFGTHVSVGFVVLLGWGLWGVGFLLQWKLSLIVTQLCPRHPLLQGDKPKSDVEDAGTAMIPSSAPPYESLTPTTHASKHELLFWGGREGCAGVMSRSHEL